MTMHFVKRLLLVLITPIFFVLLFATAINWGVVSTAGNPSDVKTILAKSGVYSSITPNLLDQAKTITYNGYVIPLDDPDVRAVASQAFSAQLFQNQTDMAIDSIYAWLDGKTAVPDFKIDLAQAKVNFANEVSQKIETRLNNLPKCTAPVTVTSSNVLTITCLPPGVVPANVADQVKAAIISGQGFLDKPVLASSDIKSSNNKSVFADQLKDVPGQYQNAKKSPYFFAALAVLSALAIILLSSSKRTGLRHVGIILLVAGVFLTAFAWAENRAISSQVVPKIKLDNSVMQAKVRVLVTDISQHIDKNYWIFGGAYTLLGVLGICVTSFWRRTKPLPEAQTPNPEPKKEQAQASSPSPPKKTAKPKPKKIIIQ